MEWTNEHGNVCRRRLFAESGNDEPESESVAQTMLVEVDDLANATDLADEDLAKEEEEDFARGLKVYVKELNIAFNVCDLDQIGKWDGPTF